MKSSGKDYMLCLVDLDKFWHFWAYDDDYFMKKL